jgi:hypothetical protein
MIGFIQNQDEGKKECAKIGKRKGVRTPQGGKCRLGPWDDDSAP